MHYLARVEGRPPSYRDFQSFEFNGKTYGMAHGTYRNIIWRLKKAGIVDVHFGKRKRQ
jgi:hypothetical protein